jgi:nitroreductase/dihydropteridine reductase
MGIHKVSYSFYSLHLDVSSLYSVHYLQPNKGTTMNTIIDDLNSRYTTKRYDESKRIPQADLDVLFEAMRLSASSINSQPWRFVVISSDKAKQRLHNTFKNKFQFNQSKALTSSEVILFAYNPKYTRKNYSEVVDQGIVDGRTKPEDRESAFGGFVFAEMNTSESGDTSGWTKAQTYLALGNTLHTLARLKIDSTPLEGIDTDLLNKAFSEELEGYQCDVALAIGYRAEDDFNAKLPKSRRQASSVFVHV